MRERLDWNTDGRDWPNRAASRFIEAGGLRWHYQQFEPQDSAAPLALLLHGTGSSTHSSRDVAPALGRRWRVIAPDLPGHAFTTMPSSSSAQSLPGMARNVGAFVKALGVAPTIIVGHSAGAAVAARMVLDGLATPSALVSLNGAFVGFGGLAGAIFSPLAKLLAAGSLTARFFASQARDPAVVQKLLRGTGSVLDATGTRLYARLIQSPGHVQAALAMMAHWDLDALDRELPRLSLPVWLVAAENDLTVPAAQTVHVASRLRDARRVLWPVLGHLAHEESPAQCVALLDEVLKRVGGQ